MERCGRRVTGEPGECGRAEERGLRRGRGGGGMEEAVARLAVPSASCLLLLGPAALAVRRRFYCEGLVFAFSSFFLAGWHACDGPDSLAWCALRPELLLYFSVYSEALSLWLSILAVGELGEPRRSTAAMLGALTTAIRVAQDPYGYGVYSGPIGGAVLIVATKFLRKMRQVKGLYPERRSYLHHIGPGCCAAGLAFTLRFFVQDIEYTYVHSAYHVLLALAFSFLLPSSNPYGLPLHNCCCPVACGSGPAALPPLPALPRGLVARLRSLDPDPDPGPDPDRDPNPSPCRHAGFPAAARSGLPEAPRRVLPPFPATLPRGLRPVSLPRGLRPVSLPQGEGSGEET
ncbi:unnamed protein product [Lampetra planeri]